ncbi:carboxylesterase/lipase family protein [Solimonas terrae]|uniref:Carboxylic ester hydrolase n=1 Tax=Solimonas terrae TaxID=1396819 RepID=A0A6M2BNM4_9GAMM|nr:carboxylesterase family protein [Solimonas terrae]NGY04242.1 carboxylesterase family protein [Solimonas terrae]
MVVAAARIAHPYMRRVSSCLLRSIACASLLLGSACAAPPEQPAAPVAASPSTAGAVLKIDSGALQGAVDGDVVAYKNIPYAAPPVGNLRWHAPMPPASWTGVRDATRYGNDCMQNRMSWDKTASPQPVSEDCLYLNVWKPASAAAGGKLPVMVWIYGGGFVSGSATAPVTDGARLAARGVVLVSFNYRVGRFGFFAHPALSHEPGHGLLGNYGLMDQIAALKWVQRNIAAFGGDPSNVTIFGESAGGESVNYLMLADQARGLFAKAYSQSGGGRTPWPMLADDLPDRPSAETAGRKFADKFKIKDDDLAALRALPADKVLGSVNMINNENGSFSGPMIDGALVTMAVADGFAAGKQARVPYINGTNSNELGFLPGFMLHIASKKMAEQFKFDVDPMIAAYGSKDAFEDHFASDLTFVEPSHFLAAAASRVQPTYLLRFAYVTKANDKGQGAAHATDVPYSFGNLMATGDTIADVDRDQARLWGDYLVAFARNGVPKAGTTTWVPYTEKANQLNEFSADGLKPISADLPGLKAITQHFGTRS